MKRKDGKREWWDEGIRKLRKDVREADERDGERESEKEKSHAAGRGSYG